jgi:ATP-dependent RNA helicase MSS116
MFGALRRCPATLSRGLSTAAISSRALRVSSFKATSALQIPSSRIAGVTSAGFHHSAKWQQIAAAETNAEAEAEAEAPSSDGLVTEFSELAKRGLVHPNIINTITKQMRLSTMTDVQTRTINEALSGVDM